MKTYQFTQGPYRGRTVASLTDAELWRAQRTCPVQYDARGEEIGPYLIAHMHLQEEAKGRAKNIRIQTRAQKEDQARRAAAREKRNAWQKSMTDVERREFTFGSAVEKKIIERTVKARIEAEAEAARKAENARLRKEHDERQKEAARREAEAKQAFFSAHPNADDWDYRAARDDEKQAKQEQYRAEAARDPFGVGMSVGMLTALSSEEGRAVIEAGYKALAKKMHPDAGGSDEQFQRLQRVKASLLGER